MFDVTLRRRIILNDGRCFEARRPMRLPIPPFAGLSLFAALCLPEGCDGGEDRITNVEFDVKAGKLYCDLDLHDYRPDRSGSDQWTEADMREHYADWSLTEEAETSQRSARPAAEFVN